MARYGNNARGIRKMIEDDRREAHAQLMAIKQPSSWICNQCGSDEFTFSVSADDLGQMSCTGCGGTEFHKFIWDAGSSALAEAEKLTK
jgi:hypothetical protein